MIVHLARDIPAFVMYCVYGASCSSLLIESTDSMIKLQVLIVLPDTEMALKTFCCLHTHKESTCINFFLVVVEAVKLMQWIGGN